MELASSPGSPDSKLPVIEGPHGQYRLFEVTGQFGSNTDETSGNAIANLTSGEIIVPGELVDPAKLLEAAKRCRRLIVPAEQFHADFCGGGIIHDPDEDTTLLG